MLQLNSSIFEYAVAEEICEHSPCQGLSKTLAARPTRHHASITDPKQVGELLRAIEGYGGTFPVACALRLAPLLFVRPSELRKADWSEFDLDGPQPQWRIPASRMKMREQHIVPLAKQAIAILHELRPLTGPTGHVFPSVRNASRPMSENTLNAALRRLLGRYPKVGRVCSPKPVHPERRSSKPAHAEASALNLSADIY